MKKFVKLSYILTMILLFNGNTSIANYDEYMYYSNLQLVQNKGINIPKIENSEYEILKEKTEQGVTKRKFSTKTYDMLSETFFNKNGMRILEKDYYHSAKINTYPNDIIVVSMNFSNDKSKIQSSLAFDANDKLPAYILSDRKNTITKIENNMNLKGTGIGIYKDNGLFKKHIFLEDNYGRIMNIYLNLSKGTLISEEEYNNLD